MPAPVSVVAAPSIDLRFAQLIKQFGLTKNSFAVSLGKTASVVQHLIDGRNKPGFDLLCKVFEVYPNVSRDWLLLGQGPLLVGSPSGIARPAPPVAATAPEPPLDPIDLRDVEPRPARRPGPGQAGSRLQPAEIAATLALATAAPSPTQAVATASGPVFAFAPAPAAAPAEAASYSNFMPAPAATALPGDCSVPATAPVVQPALQPAEPSRNGAPEVSMMNTGQAMPPPLPMAAPPVAEATAAAPVTPVASSASVSSPVPVMPAVPAGAAAVPSAGMPAVGAAAPSSSASLPLQIGPEAYVAAALHAQQLQHQLALAELRNQHLLEQQQMLREMLAMARQAMV